MVDYLRKHDSAVEYIFHQRSQGHGVEYSNVPNDTDLLIILDSSSNSVEACKKLSESMDIIIIDHHEIDVDNPHVLLVNQQQEGCDYPNKNISAVLLVHKFVELMDYNFNKVDTNYYLDLVGLGLLADSMSMLPLENRWYVNQALKQINNVGLLALIKAKRLNENKLTTFDLNFQLIPLINSAARMDKLEVALELLFEKDFKKARKLAGQMIDMNIERKEILEELTEHCLYIMKNEKFIICVSDKTSKNFNGLVAQKLLSQFGKPAIVLQSSSNSGSFRSPSDINLKEILNSCPYVEYAAGHAPAGGTQILPENMDKFIEWINTELDYVELGSNIVYDLEVEEENVDWDLIENIMEFDLVHGNGSPPITLRINNMIVDDRVLFPKSQEHVKIITEDIDILKFSDPEYAEEIDTFDIVDVVGTVSKNEFGGNKRMNLMLEDYKLHE
ncbi:single-stranded-DNA-specific exonuclease [Virgibacillus halotolerans]|nr:single-stranded-DNA-specific exonuclease [Virgibacillus halotolerans]